jgi:glycosyltransferase involved in cell wall biosynthesis
VRVLIMNEFVAGGGTEAQVNAEYDLLRRRGHDVRLITYDATFKGAPIREGHENIPFEACEGPVKWHRQLRGERGFAERLTRAVADADPDVIHLNNVFSRPKDVYAVVAPYPVVQTLRDYSVICPRDYCADDGWRECAGYRCPGSSKCSPEIKTRLQHRKLATINGFRAKAVDILLSCSQRMADKCRENGMEVTQLRDMLAPERVFKDVPVHKGAFLYYGGIAEQKGVGLLLDAFEAFARNAPGARLLLAGSIGERFQETFDRYSGMPWLEYLGYLDLSGLKDVYSRVSCVVVPSLTLDNYPNTALEAMANDTLVIGVNRGGVPEMLGQDKLLFDVLDNASVVDTLKRAWTLSDDEYDGIVAERSAAMRRVSSEDAYYAGLMGAFERAILKEGRR